jgi:LAGLIDADG-like domain
MATYRRTALLTGVDAAYIAGLVDGEGTITLSRKHRGENRQLALSISSTERPMLEFVLRRVTAGKITRKRIARSEHAPSFVYSIWNRQALDLLRQIEPHLQSYRRLRAKCILEHYVRLTPRNGKYTPGLRAERQEFERTVLAMTSRV